MDARHRRIIALVGALSAVLATSTAFALAPVPPVQSTGPAPRLPAFSGHTPRARPVPGVAAAWQDRFMAKNPGSSVHNDAWASDNYATLSGPLGRHLQTLSTAIGRDCITLAFEPDGRVIGTCTNLTQGPGMYLLDPRTLATSPSTSCPSSRPRPPPTRP
jgi:hypothetical protein